MAFPVQTISVRHKLMADLFAIGLPNKEVAERMGMTASAVSIISRSPLFQLEVEKARSRLETALLDDARQRLAAEAGRSVAKVVDLRDNAQDERVQLSAAQTLLDRTLPRRTENRETREVKITIGDRDVQRIESTMREFGDVLDATGGIAEEVQPEGDAIATDEPVRICSIDEAASSVGESDRDVERRTGYLE